MNVEALSCQCCGAPLKLGNSVCTCDYCGTTNIVSGSTGKYIDLLNRANKLRQQCEFDRAFRVYDEILAENGSFVDVLWAQTLCEYGIEYVQDPTSGRYMPTLHRIKDESILNSDSFNEAVSMADDAQKAELKNAAMEIAKIQDDYLNIAAGEKPYDVFICYKETDDETEKRTEDSDIALKLYKKLESYGLKVFFSRITLQDKLGVNYEPYIFAALKRATVMTVIGTKPEYFSAVWVRNEWSRFYKLRELNDRKLMLFACNDVDDLPPVFRQKQAQLLTEPDAIENLSENIRDYVFKIMGGNKSMVQAACPNCASVFPVDPSMQAAICPKCKKPFIVADALLMSAADLFTKNRIKCPFCGKEQEKNKYGCIYCHKEIPV
ncbi:MAG: toll/interleukin-1 receptor domain-containing protein [Lachnospiraceae bacterium]|nr:toll/interleukin-1 receptor domain-containing protein [Lachnospiraceae bacterium]